MIQEISNSLSKTKIKNKNSDDDDDDDDDDVSMCGATYWQHWCSNYDCVTVRASSMFT